MRAVPFGRLNGDGTRSVSDADSTGVIALGSSPKRQPSLCASVQQLEDFRDAKPSEKLGRAAWASALDLGDDRAGTETTATTYRRPFSVNP